MPRRFRYPGHMTIAVALSGGADSLFSLCLVREAGHPVLAVHGLLLPDSEASRFLAGRLHALCADLAVPFFAIDLRERFEAEVVAPFVREYASGRTPNPCAVCNLKIKFGALLDAARSLGAERLATGHYARTVGHPRFGATLARGADTAKEQSYFLALVPGEVLAGAVFPLGGRFKKDALAALAGFGVAPPLAVASQEICFVPRDDYQAFLLGRGVEAAGAGPVERRDGSVVGRHLGLWRHTEGQRRGLGIPAARPFYVLGKDRARNALIVGERQELLATGCRVRDPNLLVPPGLWPDEVLVQTRYRQKAAPARCEAAGDGLLVRFRDPQPRPAQGQVAAVYARDGTLLAGGVVADRAAAG